MLFGHKVTISLEQRAHIKASSLWLLSASVAAAPFCLTHDRLPDVMNQ